MSLERDNIDIDEVDEKVDEIGKLKEYNCRTGTVGFEIHTKVSELVLFIDNNIEDLKNHEEIFRRALNQIDWYIEKGGRSEYKYARKAIDWINKTDNHKLYKELENISEYRKRYAYQVEKQKRLF